MDIQLNEDAAGHIARIAAGDARSALNALELAVLTTKPDKTGKITIDLDIAQDCVQQRAMRYDKDRDNHYDTISAFIKSMRGSDPHAAVFYLAKMILAGEDVKFIARRMMILASEDIGNADPYALTLAVSAFHASHAIGLPEAQLILAQTATYLACAPKSNASTMAIGAAQADIKGGIDTLVPLHLRDSHYMSKEKLGHGVGYKYAHNYEDGYVAQSYLPDSIKNKKYYFPKDIGEEKRLKAILDHIDTIKEKKEEG
jgi:putative ATPase